MSEAISIKGDMCSVSGVRMHNEDYALIQQNLGACLADGIGGGEMGDVLARCACKAAMKSLKRGGTAVQSLSCAQSLSKEVVESMDCGNCGAALTVVRCDGEDMQVAWAGDVQCMLLDSEGQDLRVLTTPDRGERGITNAVGMSTIKTNTVNCRLAIGDRVLLCSDGVWENVSREEMREHLRAAKTPREAAVELVVGRGNSDDATVVVLFVDGCDR
ncbi:MAG: SpoIIE family protein phosphatase [Atopobiaceae bacterium]|nr:SpoIIE family protein phosphatase [Atopobiaceae bacterium]